MCLPIKFLKTWLVVTTLVTIAGGVSLFVYALVFDHQIGEVFSEF